MKQTGIAIAAGLSIAASVLVPMHAAAAGTDATCEHPGYSVTDGELRWGIKTTWRGYIKGNIARGTWKTTDNVGENGEPTDENFQFVFPVDPQSTKLALDANGNVKGSVVNTQDNGIAFQGHKGALSSTFLSPYVRTQGDKARAGTSYVSFYVPGQSMTSYTDKDRIPENRVEGKDTFTAGKVQEWKVTEQEGSDNVILELTASDLRIAPQPGTTQGTAENNWYSPIDGVDIVFLGIYSDDYKPEFDDYNVTLNAVKTCLDEDEAQSLENELLADSLPSEYKTERGQSSKLPAGLRGIFKNFYPDLDLDTAPTPDSPSEPEPPATSTETPTPSPAPVPTTSTKTPAPTPAPVPTTSTKTPAPAPVPTTSTKTPAPAPADPDGNSGLTIGEQAAIGVGAVLAIAVPLFLAPLMNPAIFGFIRPFIPAQLLSMLRPFIPWV